MNAADVFQERIQEYLDGTLDREGERLLLESLQADAQAAGELEKFLWLHQSLSGIVAPRDEAGQETVHALAGRIVAELERRQAGRIRDRTLQAIAARQSAPGGRGRGSVRRQARRSGLHAGAALAAAAAVLIALSLVLVLSGRRTPQKAAARHPGPTRQQQPRPQVALARPTGQPARVPARPALRERTSQPRPIPPLPPGPEPAAHGRVDVAGSSPQGRGEPTTGAARTAGIDREETERPIGRIAQIHGLVMYLRGAQGKWAKAVAGVSLLAGDRLDTRTGRARIAMAGGPALYVDKSTVLRLLWADTGDGQALLVDLDRGEVYCEDDGRKVHVETSDGLFSPLGTRFDVKRTPSVTIVTVEDGAVEARAKAQKSRVQGPGSRVSERDARAASRKPSHVDLRRRNWVGQAVRVTAGEQSRVRGGAPPSAPVKVDPGRILAWVGQMRKIVLDVAGIRLLSEKAPAIAAVRQGERVFRDREYRLLAVPRELEGLILIQLYNDDKKRREPGFLAFRLLRPATVYVAYTNEIRTRPRWLLDEFADAKLAVRAEAHTGHVDFQVYAKRYGPGTVSLGGPDAGSKSMYLVFIRSE